MKFRFLFFSVITVFILFSCSSDDDSNGSSVSENSITITIDGEEVEVAQFSAIKAQSFISVQAILIDDRSFDIVFHQEGNLQGANVFSLNGGFSDSFQTAEFYSENTFDFNLFEVDESDNTVSGSFDGQMFEDGFSIEEGEPLSISGEFNVPFNDITPSITSPDLEFFANIENNDWYGTNSTISTSNGNTTEWNYNETRYEIGYQYGDLSNVEEGTFTFGEETTFNRIRLNVFTEGDNFEQEEFITEGTLIITSVEVNLGIYTIEGSFNFTATSPTTGEVINVSDGRILQVSF